MTIIAPSILSADFLNLESELKKFKGIPNIWMHLDIMDGHFVPNLTFGVPVLKNLSTIIEHKLDAHLMVTNPEDYIQSLKSIGVHNFTFHWETCTHHDRLITELKKNFTSVGVSIVPSTNVEAIPEYLFDKIDLVLVMSVNPGFGGQKFIENSFSKIEKLNQIKKERSLSFEIQVDGGVTNKNAKKLIQAGATNLVAGSYIFGAENKNYELAVESLRE